MLELEDATRNNKDFEIVYKEFEVHYIYIYISFVTFYYYFFSFHCDFTFFCRLKKFVIYHSMLSF